MRGRGGRTGAYWWHFFGASVCTELFWCKIYCAKPRPDPESQSISQSRRGLGSHSPRIMREYILESAIVIWPLTQPHTCEMGSSIFSGMCRLKFESTTRSSFPIMPSNERGKGEKCFRYLLQCLPRLSIFSFYQSAISLSIGSYF